MRLRAALITPFIWSRATDHEWERGRKNAVGMRASEFTRWGHAVVTWFFIVRSAMTEVSYVAS